VIKIKHIFNACLFNFLTDSAPGGKKRRERSSSRSSTNRTPGYSRSPSVVEFDSQSSSSSPVVSSGSSVSPQPPINLEAILAQFSNSIMSQVSAAIRQSSDSNREYVRSLLLTGDDQHVADLLDLDEVQPFVPASAEVVGLPVGSMPISLPLDVELPVIEPKHEDPDNPGFPRDDTMDSS